MWNERSPHQSCHRIIVCQWKPLLLSLLYRLCPAGVLNAMTMTLLFSLLLLLLHVVNLHLLLPLRPQINLQLVAEHFVNKGQWCPIVPEVILPTPEGPGAAEPLLKLSIVPMSHLRHRQTPPTALLLSSLL